jgi:hypothetical protein
MRLFRLSLVIFLLTACSTLKFSASVEKFFQSNQAIQKPDAYRFMTSSQLPGEPFKPNLNSRIEYDDSGNLLLAPGDYLIPVMTYCMNSEGISPDGHSYFLSQMKGSRAQIIRDLNLKALPQFSYKDIQILSWSLQNGMKYDDLTNESKKIVDAVLSDYRDSLQNSLLETLEKKWNETSDYSKGIVPPFNEASDELLSKIGETGQEITAIKNFQITLKNVGNNYEALSRRIRIIKSSDESSKDIPWSRISENVFARFLTKGHYQELGQIQVRVIGQSARGPNSETPKIAVNLVSWIADPNQSGIQPLSFSPIYGFGGVLVLPALADAPILALAVLGAVLAAETVNWDAFQKLSQLLHEVKDPEVQRKIADGIQALNEIHDRLEKPLREKGIINKKTKKTSTNKDGPTREYTNPGGQEALDRDFKKLDGPSQKVDDVEVKECTDGIKAVKRPGSAKKDPTLEMQPEKTGNRPDDSTRVKVRYK